MNTHTSLGRRIVAALGAAAVGLVGLAGASTAAPTGPGNLDPDTKGTVTIHKFSEASDKGDEATGHEDDTLVPDGAEPLAGVVFTAYPIDGIDLTQNAGWDAAKALSPGGFTYDATAGTVAVGTTTYHLGAPTVLESTDSDGTAESPDLALGAYLFVETDNTGATLPNGDPASITNSAPFVVTVPLPDGDGKWNYNIHVYPKNSLTSITKEVQDGDAYKVGDTITWPVKVTLPQLPADETFEKLVIKDTFDNALTYTGVTIVSDNATTDTGDDVTFVPGAGQDFEVTNTGQAYIVTFTKGGLAKLVNGAVVTATFSTKVNDNIYADSDGIIPNQAFTNVNDSENVPSNTPESKWGGLKVHKYAQDENTKSLAGAEFDVKNASGTIVAQIITGNDGSIASATAPGGASLTVTGGAIALKAGAYTLVETKSPVGYDPITDPISVTVANGKVTEASINQIPNKQKPKVELPLTGASGQLLALLGGGALVLLAGGTALVARKRSHQNQG